MVFELDMNIGLMTYRYAFTVLTLILYQVNTTCDVTGERHGIYYGKALKVDSFAFDKLHIYTTIPDISFAACVEQCKMRYVCGFVNYRFRAKMCYILRTQDPYVTGFEDHTVDMPGFVLGVKSEWEEPEIREPVAVNQEPICRPRVHITSTRQIGNLDNTGEMVTYTCNTTLDMKIHVTQMPMLANKAYREIRDSLTGKCDEIDRVKTGHSSCYVMFWDSQSGLNAYHGDERQMNKVLTVDNGGRRGRWHDPEYCPVGTYAVGYTAEIEKIKDKSFIDDTALNGVTLYCAPINDTSMRIVSNITSGRQGFADTFPMYMCGPVGGTVSVLTSFKLKVEQEAGRDDETGANNVLFRCRDFNGTQPEQRATTDELEGKGQWSEMWSESCPPKSAVCGLETKLEDHHGYFVDDTSLNDVRVLCCRV